MNRYLPLVSVCFFLLCGPAFAEDYYLIDIAGDYKDIYVVPPGSIIDLGEGVKRAELVDVGIFSIEIDEDTFASIGDLDVMTTEVQCQSSPRQFKEDSEYAQMRRSDGPIDKTDVNPYPNWTPLTKGTFLERFAEFICQWPESQTSPEYAKMPAADSKWDMVDNVARTVDQIKSKK